MMQGGVLERMQADIGNLREAKASHETKISALDDAVVELTAAVKELTAVLNRGKGAMWAVCSASAFIGAAVTAVFEYVRH